MTSGGATDVTLTIGVKGLFTRVENNGNFAGVLSDGTVGKTALKVNFVDVTKSQTFSGANAYTGGTTVASGKLLINNTTGSGTGTGAVTVNAGGILGGTGTIGGNTTIDGVITGGDVTNIGTLTFTNSLALTATGSYSFQLNSTSGLADQLVANGVVLGGLFGINDLGATVLAGGTVFIIIDNTSGDAISGTFSNLAEGGIISSGVNQFQASYLGGTGNDLVLTVVPEPGITLLSGLGVLGLLLRRRK